MSEPTVSFWIGALRALNEPFIFFSIGAAVTGLAVFGVRHFSLVRHKELRWQSQDTSIPTLMTDIGADMDQLHSQIAVATRRLEMSVEQMKLRTSSQLSEIGKTSEAIGRLKGELAERTVAFAELQGRERAVSTHLLSIETELVVKTNELNGVEKILAERKTELARFMAEFNVHPEIGKLQLVHAAEVDSLKTEKSEVEEQLRESKEECRKLQSQLSVIEKQVEKTWATERMANAVLRERINDVASEVVRVATALEGLHSPIEAMVSAKLPTETVRAEAAARNGHTLNGHAGFDQYGFGKTSGSLPENGDEPRTALAQRIYALRKRTLETPAPG